MFIVMQDQRIGSAPRATGNPHRLRLRVGLVGTALMGVLVAVTPMITPADVEQPKVTVAH